MHPSLFGSPVMIQSASTTRPMIAGQVVPAKATESFGFKFSPGGSHISRTMMLSELVAVLADVPQGSSAAEYREAIIQRNVLSKTTDSTRQKSLRHLRELYALDEA